MFRGFLSVVLFALCFPLLWAQDIVVREIYPLRAKPGDQLIVNGSRFTGGTPSSYRFSLWFGESDYVPVALDISDGPSTQSAKTTCRFRVPNDAVSGPIGTNQGLGLFGRHVLYDNNQAEYIPSAGTPLRDDPVIEHNDLNEDGETDEKDHFQFVQITDVSVENNVMTITGESFATDVHPQSSATNRSLRVTFLAASSSCRQLSSLSTDGTTATLDLPACAVSGSISIEAFSPNYAGLSFTDTQRFYPTVTFNREVLLSADDLSIDAFTPAAARVGENVRIIGRGLSTDRNSSRISFGNDAFDTRASSITKIGDVLLINVKVPPSAGNGKIKIRYAGFVFESATDFTRTSHTVTGFGPESVQINSVITITGTNFLASEDNRVCFIGADNERCVEVAANDKEGTELKVVMTSQMPESGRIEVRVGEVAVAADGTYMRTAAPDVSFTSFTPTEVHIGDIITFTGTGFRTSDVISGGEAYNAFKETDQVELSDDRTTLKRRVNASFRTQGTVGKLTMRRCIRNCDGRPDDKEYQSWGPESDELTITDPAALTITGFSPDTVGLGFEVTLRGTGFLLYAPYNVISPGRNASINFGADVRKELVEAHEVNADGTELKFRIPYDIVLREGIDPVRRARTGKIKVFYDKALKGLDIDNKVEVSSTDDLVVRSYPEVDDFNPKTAAQGAEITVDGKYFALKASENLCTAGYGSQYGSSTTPAHWVNEDGTQLKFRVGGGFHDEDAADDTRNDGIILIRYELNPRALPTDDPADLIAANKYLERDAETRFVYNPNSADRVPVISSFSPSSGPPGTPVLISGAPFSSTEADNVVSFGDTQAAAPVGATGSSLIVLVPDDAQTGPITLVVNGKTATSSSNFTVTAPPPPTNPPPTEPPTTNPPPTEPPTTNPPTNPPTEPPTTNPPPTEPPTTNPPPTEPPMPPPPDPLRFYSDVSRMTPQASAYMADVTASATEDTDLQDIYVGGPGTLSLLLVENESSTEAYEHPSFKLTATTAGQHYKVQVKDISSLTAGSAHTLHLYLSTNEANVDAVRTTVVVTIAVEASSVDLNFYSSSARTEVQASYTGSVAANATADAEVANIYAGGPGMLTLLLVEKMRTAPMRMIIRTLSS